MEFKQVAETSSLKVVGTIESTIKMRDVAQKCKLVSTDSGLKIECNYTGPNASQYLSFIEKHREDLTQYLMNPDTMDFYDWMEISHQTQLKLKKHEKENLVLGVTFDPETQLLETGIMDDNLTVKLGAPLIRIHINDYDRDSFKLRIYNMLLLADEIALAMGNDALRQMANIEMVKTYLSDIYDKYVMPRQPQYE
ncbi:MAG: hypothetical protein K6B72_06280 [Lachnospiraceae bacterium]|nr:hypothetical protein [Lachnospiraceae bacterium]